MAILTEGRHACEGLLSEANFHRSRDQITISSGSGVLVPGTVLGQLVDGTAAATANGANTGDATISAITVDSGAKSGTYVVEFTTATKFDVIDPDGYKIKSGTTGTAYSDDLGFTITAGGNAMVAGDGFTIEVALDKGAYKPATATGTDGAQVASAVLLYPVDATSADVGVAAITRDAEFVASTLTYGSTVDADTKKAAKNAQLAAVGIIVRA